MGELGGWRLPKNQQNALNLPCKRSMQNSMKSSQFQMTYFISVTQGTFAT